MRRIIAGNEQRNDRTTKIFYKHRFVKYPFENGLSDLTHRSRFFCINEYIKTLIAVEKGEIPAPVNFREWIYYTFGKGIAECYMIPYNEKIWKYPTDNMSLHWVDGRIPRPPVEDIIKSAIGIETEGYTHQSAFSYPLDGGIIALVRAIALPIEPSIKPDSGLHRSQNPEIFGRSAMVMNASRPSSVSARSRFSTCCPALRGFPAK